MRIVRARTDFPDKAKGAVVAIGNFDGVHRGHSALLEAARHRAQTLGVPLAALTFEPHPRRLFKPDDPPFRVLSLDLKRDLLAAAGVDILVALAFDWPFASQSAEHFIEEILRKGLGGGPVYVGPDFRFGQLRRGDVEALRAAGLEVSAFAAIRDAQGEVFSSSRVRAAIRSGDMQAAQAVLGRPWEIRGVVVRGDQRGRQIGYPTANVALGETIHPDYGVYAALVRVREDGPEAPWLLSATNIGIRPMFEVPTGQVEAHILDFNRDIYGKTLCLRPVRRLRGEAKFDGLDALIAQIAKDCEEARAVLAGQGDCATLA